MDTATKSSSHAIITILLRLKISDEESLLILIKLKTVITGSLYSVSFMQAESLKTTGIIMTSHSDLTVLDFVQHSMLRRLWTLKYTTTGIIIRFILKKAKMSEDFLRRKPAVNRQVRKSHGNPTLMFLRILI